MNKNLNKNDIIELEDDYSELEKELEMLIKNIPIIDITISEEQKKIINSKSNIKIDAVAGSGKTTTILHMSLLYPDKNIFQITYNNMLKREVRKKVNRLGIQNMNIHTYHSLAVNFYDQNSYTDEGIKKIILYDKQIIPNIIYRPIDILFIDESQDMILDYYKLLKKFIYDTKSNPQIIILGDKYQGIYEFKGANIKFLTLADKIWNNNFIELTLSISYRLTNQISWFINNIMLGYNRIITNKSGPPVDYYIANSYKIYKKIGKYLLNIIKNETILASDIFILIPSVKTLDSPYKKLENYLVKHGIKCITSTSDDSKLDDKIISNKVVFTTYHQAKGRERKVVILYNFDSSYTEYYNNRNNINEENNLKICPNTLYVGVTRASWKLILIQDIKSKPLEFLNIKKFQFNDNINIIQTEKIHFINKISNLKNDKRRISVIDLVKFITPYTLDIIINLIDKIFIHISKPSEIINIPNKIEILSNKYTIWEDVSDLNGLVIPAILESKLNKTTSTIENYVLKQINEKQVEHEYIKYIGKINIPCITINDYLKIGNVYLFLQNKLLAKLVQIKKYNWLNNKMVLLCHKYMEMIDSNTIFEIPICSLDSPYDYLEYEHDIYGQIQIGGRLDAISNDVIWEFKCVDCITIEHKLQLITYYWMWEKSNMKLKYGNKKFNLINIKSGQILQLDTNNNIFYQIDQIVQILFDEKYLKKNGLDDDEFINMCIK